MKSHVILSDQMHERHLERALQIDEFHIKNACVRRDKKLNALVSKLGATGCATCKCLLMTIAMYLLVETKDARLHDYRSICFRKLFH